MKTAKFFMAFMAAALLASCSDSDEDYSGDLAADQGPGHPATGTDRHADDTQAARA